MTAEMRRTRLLAAIAPIIVIAELLAHDAKLPDWLVLSAWGIGLAALLLLVVLPRVDRSAWPVLSLSFGVTALITCVAFWSALPFAFGAAAIAASEERRTAPGAVLGALAMLLALVFCIIA